MFRVCLIVCFSLIYGIPAKPYKPWNKIHDAAFQDTIMTKEEGKLSSEVLVEPPQGKHANDYDIDPGMTIWKSMSGIGQDRQYLTADVDTDELHHPSVAELLRAQLQNPNILEELRESSYLPKPQRGLSDIHAKKVSLIEPEQDMDEVYHKAREELDVYLHPLGAKPNVDLAHAEPEEAMDNLYQAETRVRLHLRPEEDHDDLYHSELVNPANTPVQMGKQLPIDQSSQRKYSEPEEDLDGLYHH